MTKEEVLQKANEYCSEKGYTTETLTDEFKDKFSDFFAKKYAEQSADDETALADLQFNLNTAFSATSKGITMKQKGFEEKENDYKRQIEELKKKVAKGDDKKVEIPKAVQDKLDRLERFETEHSKREKYEKVLELAKKNVRVDLHKSFESYAKDFEVNLDETDDAQAKKLTDRFQEIFRDSIGDIKPLAPQVKEKREEEIIASIPKVKVV